MIQDIFPKHLDNQYKAAVPENDDVIFLFENAGLLVKNNEKECLYPDYKKFAESVYKSTGKQAESIYDFIYLLSIDKEKFFLAMPKEDNFIKDSAAYGMLNEGYGFTAINMFRQAKPKYKAFAAITAYHLYMWYRNNKFCGRCGQRLVHDTKERMLKCPECNNEIYPRISPAVIVAVTNKNKLLLTKYARGIYKNYALVAGFAEIGETLEETVKREVMEEVGVKVKNIRYYKSQPWALSGSLLSGFFCELDGDDTIHLQEDELSVGKWFKADDIDTIDDGISLTREMINKFVSDTLGN